jgi:hypothetical protein
VVSAENCVDLGPWHLVAILDSGGEVSRLSTHASTKLLGHEQSLLELSAVQKPKLRFNYVKPVIHLQWISRLDKCRRAHC